MKKFSPIDTLSYRIMSEIPNNKNRYHENVWYRVFLDALENFVFLKIIQPLF